MEEGGKSEARKPLGFIDPKNITTMKTPEEVTERIKATLQGMVEQGLPADKAQQAQECAGKMLGLVGEYEFAGVLALGLVGGIIDELFPG